MPYVTGLLSLQRACAAAGIGFEYFYVSGTALLHEHRNVAAAAFLNHTDLSHMIYIDADIGFEGFDIVRMFAEQRTSSWVPIRPSTSTGLRSSRARARGPT